MARDSTASKTKPELLEPGTNGTHSRLMVDWQPFFLAVMADANELEWDVLDSDHTWPW